jgi:hypothetical protein
VWRRLPVVWWRGKNSSMPPQARTWEGTSENSPQATAGPVRLGGGVQKTSSPDGMVGLLQKSMV